MKASEIIQTEIDQLLLHGGIGPSDPHRDDLGLCLRDIKRTGKLDAERLSRTIRAVTGSLQTINRALSAQRYSTVPDQRLLPETLAYGVSGILRLLVTVHRELEAIHTAQNVLKALLDALYVVTTVWDDFLAGDIDDLSQELRFDVITREFEIPLFLDDLPNEENPQTSDSA